MKNYKAIFVDIDNTLLDFDAYVKETMKTGFAHFGLKPYEAWMYDAFETENNKLWRRIEDGTLTFEELQKIRWNNAFKAIGIEFDGVVFEKYFRAALNESAIPVEGAFEMLDFLKGKAVLCVASNGPFNQQVNRLTIGHMKDYFDYLFISEDIGASKPSKEFFDEAFARLNKNREEAIKPSECLFIGDSLTSDMAGGRNAGMDVCFFMKHPKDVGGEKLNYIVKSLKEVAKTLE